MGSGDSEGFLRLAWSWNLLNEEVESIMKAILGGKKLWFLQQIRCRGQKGMEGRERTERREKVNLIFFN